MENLKDLVRSGVKYYFEELMHKNEGADADEVARRSLHYARDAFASFPVVYVPKESRSVRLGHDMASAESLRTVVALSIPIESLLLTPLSWPTSDSSALTQLHKTLNDVAKEDRVAELFFKLTNSKISAVLSTSLLENPVCLEPRHFRLTHKLLQISVSDVRSVKDHVISGGGDRMNILIDVCHQFITVQWYGSGDSHPSITGASKFFSILNELDKSSSGRRLPTSIWYNSAICGMDDETIFRIFRRWKGNESANSFVPFMYKFLMNAAMKGKLLKLENTVAQRREAQEAFLGHVLFNARGNPYLVLNVFRDHIIQSSLNELSRVSPGDLKKPLRVHFVGENGVDEGGLTKEFFQILVRELFDPSFGMFSYNEETREFWFSGNSLESDEEFGLVGMLLGLATYNSVILDVHFPMVVYKKLLHGVVDLNDLIDMDPLVGMSLSRLLEFEDSDSVEETFALTFQATEDVFGEKRVVDLAPGGADVSVTCENRKEYVEKYVKLKLETSVERQFRSFERGFYKVCDERMMEMFEPEELELVICGSRELDFRALEENAHYGEGYEADSRVVLNFWSIFHEYSTEQKKKLLFFVTGSDRVPIQGLGKMKFVILRHGPDCDRLPTAHTCFSTLMLPEYRTKEKLKRLLLLAINNSEGFGLI